MRKLLGGEQIEVYRSTVNVIGNEHVKIVFHAYLCQMWIDLRQTKTKMMIIIIIIVKFVKSHTRSYRGTSGGVNQAA